MRVVIALILVLLPTVAVAQPSQGVVTMLSGQATLTRRAPVPPQPLRFKDDLFEYDRVNTGERSLVRVLLGGKALVTVRELSVFTVAEETRAQTVRLTWGKLAVSVAHSRMRPGEAIEIRTPNAIAAVRGTVVIVEVLPPSIPGATPNTLIRVIRGTVGVTRADRIGSAEVSVRAGQVYDVAADRLRTLAPAETASTWADLVTGPDRTDAIVSCVDAWVDMNVKMLRQNAALDDIIAMDPKRQRRTLLSIVSEYKAIYLAFTIAPDGSNIGRSDQEPPKNYGDRTYVQQVLRGAPLGQQVVISRTNGQPALILLAIEDVNKAKQLEEEKDLRSMLAERVADLEKFHDCAVDRELKMIELGKENKELKQKLIGLQAGESSGSHT